MPGAVVEPQVLNGHSPGLLTRLRVRLHASQLDRALAGSTSPNESVELRMRADQLVDERERNRTASSIQHVLDLAQQGRRIFLGLTRLPVDRRRIEANRAELKRIVETLRGPSPVSPRGVAMARRLITDFRGPIYTGGPNSRLPEALSATQSALS